MAWCEKCLRNWGHCDETDATCQRIALGAPKAMGFVEWFNDPLTQKVVNAKADLSVKVDRLERRVASQRRRITRLIEVAKRYRQSST